MNPFMMKGQWGKVDAFIYATVVAPSLARGFARFLDEGVPAPPPAGCVVDVGCGAGQLAALLGERHPGCEVLGIDSSPDMIRWAKRLSGRQGNVRFEVGDAMSLPLPDGSADLVTCVTSIKHWPDQALGLREIRRVLKPGCPLCLVEVDPECSTETARRFVGRWRFMLAPACGLIAAYFRRFVARGGLPLGRLTELARQAGLVELHPRQLDGIPLVYLRAYCPTA